MRFSRLSIVAHSHVELMNTVNVEKKNPNHVCFSFILNCLVK